MRTFCRSRHMLQKKFFFENGRPRCSRERTVQSTCAETQTNLLVLPVASRVTIVEVQQRVIPSEVTKSSAILLYPEALSGESEAIVARTRRLSRVNGRFVEPIFFSHKHGRRLQGGLMPSVFLDVTMAVYSTQEAQAGAGQTLESSFSAVSTPNFVIKVTSLI